MLLAVTNEARAIPGGRICNLKNILLAVTGFCIWHNSGDFVLGDAANFGIFYEARVLTPFNLYSKTI
jgi:hypothetical protein